MSDSSSVTEQLDTSSKSDMEILEESSSEDSVSPELEDETESESLGSPASGSGLSSAGRVGCCCSPTGACVSSAAKLADGT